MVFPPQGVEGAAVGPQAAVDQPPLLQCGEGAVDGGAVAAGRVADALGHRLGCQGPARLQEGGQHQLPLAGDPHPPLPQEGVCLFSHLVFHNSTPLWLKNSRLFPLKAQQLQGNARPDADGQ